MILANKTYKIIGDKDAPRNHLLNYKSVVKAELINTSRGYFIQKFRGRYYFIPFFQTDMYDGTWDLFVGEFFAVEENINNLKL